MDSGLEEAGMNWDEQLGNQRRRVDEGLHRCHSGHGGRDGDTALGRVIGAVSLWS